jgi:hypothetical protein
MSTDDESLKTVNETYRKLSDLKNQLTALTNMSKVLLDPNLLSDIKNHIVTMDELQEKYRRLPSGNEVSSQSDEEGKNAIEAAKHTLNKLTGKVNIWNKAVGLNKMARFLLFIFMFFFIFKVIDHILDFFDVNKDLGYIYFVWFTIMFFLFVILPLQKSRLTVIPKLEE